MAGVSLSQLNTSPPPVLALKVMLIAAPGHTLTPTTALGIGSGSTVMVKVSNGPVHPFKVASTLTVTTIGAAPALVATNEGIS